MYVWGPSEDLAAALVPLGVFAILGCLGELRGGGSSGSRRVLGSFGKATKGVRVFFVRGEFAHCIPKYGNFQKCVILQRLSAGKAFHFLFIVLRDIHFVER